MLSAVELVSVADPSLIPDSGGGEIAEMSVSEDGRYVAFTSDFDNLVPGDSNGTRDVFVRDLVNGTTELVSVAAGAGSGNGHSDNPVISADGSTIVFLSYASDLVPGDGNGTPDVFVRHLAAGTTELVSVATGGGSANGISRYAVISADGSIVAFWSGASDLVAGDSNGTSDVFVRDLSAGTTELVSVAVGGGSGNGYCGGDPVLSADGSTVAFSSYASDLVADDNNGRTDVFVRDLAAGTTELVSVAADGGSGNGNSPSAVISADGSTVAFESGASDLVAGDNNGASDVFVRDLAAGTTELVSIAAAGGSGNHFSRDPVISADGSTIAFHSYASDLVANDNNGTTDVFVRDLSADTTELVSVSAVGGSGNGYSSGPVLSAHGGSVAFHSSASDLVAGDGNGTHDVFVRDLAAGTTELVSIAAGGSGNSQSGNPVISADGGTVAFESYASDLVTGDTNQQFDVFARDLDADATQLVSVRDPDVPSLVGARSSGRQRVSADGRFVVFASNADNLVPGDNNGTSDIFVRDLAAGTTELVSVAAGGDSGSSNDGSSNPVISADGSTVAFLSLASDLVAGDNNGMYDVFVRDLSAGTTELVSVAADGESGDGVSEYPVISADGGTVAFRSFASDLVAGDNNGTSDIFVRRLATGTTELVSVSASGDSGNGYSLGPVISADGSTVTFASYARDLVAGDNNGTRDVFVRDLAAGTTELVSVATGGGSGNGISGDPVLSADGRTVAFQSYARDLVAGDGNGTYDIFVRDLAAGTTDLVSVATGGDSGNGFSFGPVLSADGGTVAFQSSASDLVAGDDNGGRSDVFVRNLSGGTTELVSVATGGGSGNGHSYRPVLSADGGTIAFWSSASDLVAYDGNGASDVFVRALSAGTTELVSVAASGGSGNGSSDNPVISADGSTVAFVSEASDLVEGDFNNREDVFAMRFLPEVRQVDLGRDLASVIVQFVQFNQADLDQSLAETFDNYEILAANGDADGDGDFFNDGDEAPVTISSVGYDATLNHVTITTDQHLFGDLYRVNLDGDDAAADGTPGIADLRGNFLLGGDFSTELDARALALVEALVAKVEALGLDTGSESSLIGKLTGAAQQLDQDVGSDAGVVAVLEAFIAGVNRWFDREEITETQHDELVTGTELIIAGLTGTGSALYVDNSGPGTATGASLREPMLHSAVTEAMAWWGSAGYDSAAAALPGGLDVRVADLWGGLLGMASSSGTLWIDRDAAGYGWSTGNSAGGVDLLPVVTHEVGHLLGLDHGDDHQVMAPTLAPGVALDGALDGRSGVRPSISRSVVPNGFRSGLPGPALAEGRMDDDLQNTLQEIERNVAARTDTSLRESQPVVLDGARSSAPDGSWIDLAGAGGGAAESTDDDARAVDRLFDEPNFLDNLLSDALAFSP